jgi:hypothetical protein
MLFNSGEAAKVSRIERSARGRMPHVPASGEVLRVKRSNRRRDIGPDAYNALLYSGPKQCNPKIAAKEQFGAPTEDGLPRWAVQ